MPLSRHRCVESPRPTNSAPIKLYRFRGRLYLSALRTFSLFTFTYYFERSETNPSVSALPSRLPCMGAEKQANEVRPYGRNNKFCEDFVPLTRQRCVESPHPTSCVSINLYRLHGRRYPLIPRTFSLFTFTYYFERSETPSTGEPK